MLSLTANNQTLDIDLRNLKFNITYRNSYFGFLNSAVFNFSIPYTANNARTFNFPSRLNRLVKSIAVAPGRIIDDGIELASGTWEAISSGEETIELSFTFIADEIVSALTGKTLPDIHDEIITTTDILEHVSETAFLTYPETEYQFPSIYAESFYQDNENFLKVINYFEGSFVMDSFNTNTVVPMLYLFSIIRRIFSYAGYEVSGTVFNDTLLQKALIFNNYALDHLVNVYLFAELEEDYTTVLPMCYIKFDKIDDEANNFDITMGAYTCPAPGGSYVVNAKICHRLTEEWNELEPQLFRVIIIKETNGVGTVWHEFENAYGGNNVHETTFYEKSFTVLPTNVVRIYILAGQIESYPSNSFSKGIEIMAENTYFEMTADSDSQNVNVYQNSFNLKNHVPPTDCIEFLQFFCSDYQQFIKIDKISKNATFIPIADIFKSLPYTDLTPGLVRNTLKIKQSQYKGFSLKFDFDYDSVFTPDNHDTTVQYYAQLPTLTKPACALVLSLLSYFQNTYDEDTEEWYWEFLSFLSPFEEDGAKENEIVLHFAPLLMRNFVNRNDVNISLPVYGDSGTSHPYGQQNEFPIRIIFYAGMEASAAAEANYYPFATTSKYNANYLSVLACNYTAAEISARYWEQTIAWLKERLEIEFERRFTNLELRNLIFEKPAMFLDSKIFTEEVFAQFDPELRTCKLKAWTTP